MNQPFFSVIKSTEAEGNRWIYDDTRRYLDPQAHVPGVWKTVRMPCFSQQSETCFQSETSPALKPLYCSFLLFFPVVVFLFLSLSPHPFLQMRLDEDRPVFINHPLKRNPWRSIINDFATNFEEVPRPNVIRSVECILRFEIRARLTRNRRPDSLTPGSFFICRERFAVRVRLHMHFDSQVWMQTSKDLCVCCSRNKTLKSNSIYIII